GAAIKAGDTVDIGTADGENNLAVVKSGNTIKYSLKKTLDLGDAGSVTTGNTVTNSAGVTVNDGAGNKTVTAANGMTVIDGNDNGARYDAQGLTFINTSTGDTLSGVPSVTKDGINAGKTVIRDVASGLEGKTLDAIKTEGSSSAQWSNAATVGDLTQVQSNVTNVSHNVTNVTQALGGQDDSLVDKQGNLTREGQKALITYNVADQAEYVNNSVIGAINKMNEEGIKFIHVNNENPGTEIPKEGSNNIDSSAGGAYSTAIGYQAKVGYQAENGIAIGKGSTVTGSDSIAIGTGNEVTGSGSGAIGDPSTVSGNSSYSIGNDNKVKSDNSFVLGNNVSKTANNSVNLGAKSAAYTEANKATAGTTEYKQSKINGDTYNYAGGNAAGVVTVGDAGSERRVQNVAAGLISADSTDAINGSQLYGTNKAIEKLANNISSTSGNVSKGLNIGDGSSANNYQLGETVNVTGDDNISTQTTADGVKVSLNDNISVQSVTADDGKGNVTTLDTAGTSVKDAAGNSSNYGAKGTTIADADGNQNITTAKGATVKDAAGNKTTSTAEGVTVTDGENSAIYSSKGITFANNKGNDNVNTNGPQVTVEGISAGDYAVTNVAPGKVSEGSTDAINGGQLYETNRAITQVANGVNELGYKLDGVRKEANAGISSAMAMASMPQAYLPGKSMISGGIASYNGEGAVAVGVSKLSDNGRWVFKINGSADTEGNAGAAAGIGMHW
ncbi:YadA family autotransporter adhesin, partial [Psychrobacter pygoscelis]|uniref:YadA family autotransporter adhesin n=1 Tax=Psychrobacter pygoscelis TaxID=2488563 RepID=UPI001A955D63